jgi:hypothetical protein
MLHPGAKSGGRGFGAGSGPAHRAVRPPRPGGARLARRGDRLVVCLIAAVTLLSPFLDGLGAG